MSHDKQQSIRALIVMTSHGRFGDTGRATGAWYSEVAGPYFVLRDAGCDVTLASVSGGAAVIDPLSCASEWQTEATRRADGDTRLQEALGATLLIADVDASAYDAILLAGGFGAMWDMPASGHLRAVVESVYASRSQVLATLCHGAAGLVAATDVNGTPLVEGRIVTCFTDAEERAVGGDAVVPFLLESRLRALGADFRGGADWSDTVHVSGRLVTGQNPASAESAARAVLRSLTGLRE